METGTLIDYPLNITEEIAYARKWAYLRNPEFYNFEDIGGDCTNFVSQCLYAGGATMNFTPDTGWYYISVEDRAAAWTGVEYFYRFVVNNKGVGPYGYETELEDIKVGDVIQLGRDEGFYHTMLVVAIVEGEPYITAHSYDAFTRPISSYNYSRLRCIHISGSRKVIA